MGNLFGTDGVRGVANHDLTCEMAFALGRAGAQVLVGHDKARPLVLVGKDTRISGDMLAYALMAGLCSAGAHAIDLGVVTTPCVAYLTTTTAGAGAGVVISASHNPAKDNGIKFFSHTGHKLTDAIEDEIEALMREQTPQTALPIGGDVGRVQAGAHLVHSYAAHCAKVLKAPARGIKVVLDCANGAASAIAPAIFSEAGCDVVALHAQPDGLNINDGCGSTHPQSLMRAVVEQGAAMGFAFDGDADRLLAVDERGRLVDGDQILAMLAIDLKARGALANDTVVSTVMGNMGLEIAMRERGIRMLRAQVGDRYVLAEMLAGGHVLGGEQSGHIIQLRHTTTGDGIAAALQILAVALSSGKPLSELADTVVRMPQVLLNVKVAPAIKDQLAHNEAMLARIAQVERELGDKGRVLVRASGTESLVRIMLEGQDEAELHAYAQSIHDAMVS